MDTIKIRKGRTKLIAHRGVSGLELENTCAAFIAAGNRSYFGIETDVRVTADGKFILIHDSVTKRVGTENRTVEESAFADLRNIRLKQKDGTVRCDLWLASLEEYLTICRRYEKTAVLELKPAMDRETVREIVALCSEICGLEHMVFIGYDMQNLLHVRNCAPQAKIQLLLKTPLTQEHICFMETNGIDLDAHHAILSEEWIKELHAKGILVNCWTIDDPARAEELISWGVDQLTTNILENT